MKRLFLLFMLLALVIAALPARPVSALSGGQDDRAHAYVGLVTDFDRTCVGVALSPQAVATAASCFLEDGQDVWVTLDATAASPEKPVLISGVWIAHPDACLGCPAGLARLAGVDVAVVILDEPLALSEYASLPVLDDFIRMQEGGPLDVAGYSINTLSMVDGLLAADFRRQAAPVDLVPPGQRANSQLRILSERTGENCFLAAGGPLLLGDSHVLLGLVSGYEHQNCSRTAAVTALNNESAIQFLQEAVQDPAGLKARHDS